MNPLQTFYNQPSVRKAVQEFQTTTLREMAADAAFDGDSTAGFAPAHDLINKSFAKLDEMYAKVEAPTVSNSR